MSKIIPGNQKHLSLEDRLFIEQSLNQGLSFKEIAKYLCKDPSTILRSEETPSIELVSQGQLSEQKELLRSSLPVS